MRFCSTAALWPEESLSYQGWVHSEDSRGHLEGTRLLSSSGMSGWPLGWGICFSSPHQGLPGWSWVLFGGFTSHALSFSWHFPVILSLLFENFQSSPSFCLWNKLSPKWTLLTQVTKRQFLAHYLTQKLSWAFFWALCDRVVSQQLEWKDTSDRNLNLMFSGYQLLNLLKF